MKKIFTILGLGVIVALAASCEKGLVETSSPEAEKTVTLSFSASMDSEMTRTTIDGKKVMWEAGDQIGLFVYNYIVRHTDSGDFDLSDPSNWPWNAANGSARAGHSTIGTPNLTLISDPLSSAGETATFTFTLSESDANKVRAADYYVAVFPFRERDEANDITYYNCYADDLVNAPTDSYTRAYIRYVFPQEQTNGSAQIAYAYSTNNQLSFQNLNSLIKFNTSNATVKKAVLSGNNTETLSYSALKYTYETDTYAAFSGATAITSITNTDVKTGDNFFALKPGVTLSNGFTITLYDSSDKEVGSFVYGSSYTTARNRLTNIANFDSRVEDTGKAVLKDGYSVNAALKKLADGGTPSYYTNNTSITSIVVDTRSSVNTGTLVSATSSAFPIYANFDGGVITLSTPAGKVYFPSDASAFFYYMRGLTSVDMKRMSTEDVVSANQMFAFCSALPTFGNIDFPKATNASYMFTNCTSLQTVGEINLPLAQNVGNLLSGCPIQTLGDLNLPAATNTSFAFQNCGSLTQVGAVNMPLVQDASYMFSYCGSLATIGPIQMDAITTATSMFDSCGSLTSLTINGVGNNTLVNMGRMFYGCAELSMLSFSPVTNVATSTDQMYYNCKKLTSVDISGISGNLASVSGMFYNCELLTGISFNSAFNTSAVTSFSAMFSGCLALASLDLSTFDTSAATNMYEMFRACRNLTTIGATTVFTTTALTSTDRMFSGCRILESVDLSSLAGHLESITEMFSSCEKLTTIHLSNNFNTEAVANYSYVFYYCRSLSQLYIKGFHLTKGVIGTTTVSSRMMNALGSVPTSCTIHYTTHNSSTEYDVRYFLPYTTTSGSGTGGYNWTTAN